MKISAAELNSIHTKDSTSFNGLKRMYDENLEDVYRFYAPPYDKDKYAVVLEMCEVRRDKNGKHFVSVRPFVYNDSFKQFRDSKVTDISRSWEITEPEEIFFDNPMGIGKKEDKFIGYRYRLIDKMKANKIDKEQDLPQADYDSPFLKLEAEFMYDPGARVSSPYGEFTVLSNKMGMTPKSGSALHVFYDSNESSPNINRKTFVRNHVNKAGGDLDSIIKFKDEIAPYRYIMTNPYMGRDTKSSHKYWGEEFFQMPSPSKFKKVITELYKDGKGYIADGAITSQSIQSPLFQHVLKYGQKSPFYQWFKINSRLKLGVLPDDIKSTNPKRVKAMDNIGFKIINPKGVSGYNPNKPSYIQFFDKRLASPEQQNDTKNFIDTYANATTEDHFDISTHEDSVLPYSFELDYSDKSVRERFSGYVNKMLTDDDIKDKLDTFFSFKNFDITTKGHASGADFWDGNVDLVKMNLSHPSAYLANVKGHEQVKNHMLAVATYWTKFANDSLLEYLVDCFAENKTDEIAHIAKANDVTAQELETLLENAVNDEMNANAATVSAKSIIDESINEFRYETLSASPQVAAVLASPDFQQVMSSPKVKDKLYNYAIETLRKLDGSTMEDIIEPSSEVTDIITVESTTKQEFNKTIKLTPYGEQMAKMLVPKIISYAVLKAMFPKDEVYLDTNDCLIKTSKELKERSLQETGVLPSGLPDDEARQLAKIITKRLGYEKDCEIQQSNLSDQLSDTKYAKFKLKDFRLAQVLLKKTGGGLNWRFDAAKDIADLTRARNGVYDFKDAWDDVCDFWGKFVSNVRKINPSSYIIAEVTDLWSIYNSPMYAEEARKILEKEYESQGKNIYNITEDEIDAKVKAIKAEDWGEYCNPDVAERMLFEKTGATTSSNYSTFFNQFPNMFGQNFEWGNVSNDFYANMGKLRENMEKYLKSGPLLYLTHSHIFADNHDKPRAIHCLALDVGAYLSRFGINSDSKTSESDIKNAKEAAKRVIGKEPENYDVISSKGIVVADAFLRAFEKVLKKKPAELAIVKKAVRDLALGKFKEKIEWDFLRAESFGQNDFHISINDVMEQAKYLAQQEGKNWFNEAETARITQDTFNEVIGAATQKMEKMSDVMSAVTGIPFFYAGDNMGQSGYEYASKNIAVANRDLIRREWIDRNSPEYNPYVKKYYDRMQASASMYQQHGLSAIAGGMPVSLPQQNGRSLYAILKYDDKGSNVIHVLSNVGMTKDPYSKMDENAQMSVNSISVKDEKGHELQICSGTETLRRMVYDKKAGKFVDEKDERGNIINYTVIKGEMRRTDGKPIIINDTVSTFYKPLGISKVTHEDIMRRFHAA